MPASALPRRFTLAGALLIAGLLSVACGSDDSTEATSIEPALTPTTTATTPAGDDTEPAAAVDAEASDDSSERAEVTIRVAGGSEMAVPVTTEGILALDEFAAQLLLILGVTPQASVQIFGDEANNIVLADAGIATLEPQNVELVATESPALIIGTNTPFNTDQVPLLEEIAPTVIPEVSSREWRDVLRAVAAVTGTSGRAEEIIDRIDGRLADLADAVGDSANAGATLSILTDRGDGTIFALTAPAVPGVIAEELGLARPPDQLDADQTSGGFLMLSQELLPDQQADITVSLEGEMFTGGASLFDNPLYPGSPTEAAVLGALWSTETPLSVWWMLADYEAILLGDGQGNTFDDTLDLWNELTS
ncbi:MAG: ABC transporter substrate-binding protein [Actinomycetota bacterium]